MNANSSSAAPLAVNYFEAGRLCGVHPETIARAVRRGELPAAAIGRARRVRLADLDDWLRRKAGSVAEPEGTGD